MMILVYRPYDVGDLIEAAGAFGKVSHMSLVCTTILTVDNQTLVVPNTKIWGDVIKNVTAQKIRRVDLVHNIFQQFLCLFSVDGVAIGALPLTAAPAAESGSFRRHECEAQEKQSCGGEEQRTVQDH